MAHLSLNGTLYHLRYNPKRNFENFQNLRYLRITWWTPNLNLKLFLRSKPVLNPFKPRMNQFNYHTGGMSLWKPKAVKSIFREILSLNRHHFLRFYPQFHFNTFYSNHYFWKIIPCLEKKFLERELPIFQTMLKTRFQQIIFFIEFLLSKMK